MSNIKRSDGVFIVYPQKCFATVDNINTWYHDAEANNELDLVGIPDDQWYEQAKELDDIGHITLRSNT